MKALIEIGFSRWNEATFSVGCKLSDLSYEKMQQLRAVIPVAIGVAEDMWRREQDKKNPAAQSETPKVLEGQSPFHVVNKETK
jgi:hypothetical protein